jgi:hypothetical protein
MQRRTIGRLKFCIVRCVLVIVARSVSCKTRTLTRELPSGLDDLIKRMCPNHESRNCSAQVSRYMLVLVYPGYFIQKAILTHDPKGGWDNKERGQHSTVFNVIKINLFSQSSSSMRSRNRSLSDCSSEWNVNISINSPTIHHMFPQQSTVWWKLLYFLR